MKFVSTSRSNPKVETSGVKFTPTARASKNNYAEQKDYKLNGVGYLLGKVGAGAYSVGVGAYNLIKGLQYKSQGFDDYAVKQFTDNSSSKLSQMYDDLYSPSKGMKFAGGVAEGIGQNVSRLPLAWIPVVGQGLYGATTALGYIGMSTEDSVATTKNLGGKELAFGVLQGSMDTALDMVGNAFSGLIPSKLQVTDVTGKFFRDTAVGTLKSGASEFAEEFIESYTDVLYKRMLDIDPNATVSIKDALYEGAVGFASGAFLGGVGASANNVRLSTVGKNILDSGKAESLINFSQQLMAQYSGTDMKKGAFYDEVKGVIQDNINNYKNAPSANSIQAQVALGNLFYASNYFEEFASKMTPTIDVITNNADKFLNAAKAIDENATVEQLQDRDSQIVRYLAAMDYASNFINEDYNVVKMAQAQEETNKQNIEYLKSQATDEESKNAPSMRHITSSGHWGTDGDFGADGAVFEITPNERLNIAKVGDKGYRLVLEEGDKIGKVTTKDGKVYMSEDEVKNTLKSMRDEFASLKKDKTEAKEEQKEETKEAPKEETKDEKEQAEAEQKQEVLEEKQTYKLTNDVAKASDSLLASFGAKVKEKAKKVFKNIDDISAERRVAIYTMLQSAGDTDESVLKALCNYISKRRGLYVVMNQDLIMGGGLFSTSNTNRYILTRSGNKSIMDTVTHEIFHSLRGTKTWDRLNNDALEYAIKHEAELGLEKTDLAHYLDRYNQVYYKGKANEFADYSKKNGIQEALKKYDGEGKIQEELAANVLGKKLGTKRMMKLISGYGEGNKFLSAIKSVMKFTSKGDKLNEELAKLESEYMQVMDETITKEDKEAEAIAEEIAKLFNGDTTRYNIIAEFDDKGKLTGYKEALLNMAQSKGTVDATKKAIEQVYSKNGWLNLWNDISQKQQSSVLNEWNERINRVYEMFPQQMGYKYNQELASECAKGLALFDAINKMSEDDLFKKYGIKFDAKSKQAMYAVLKENGLLIPCAICYVEEARRREGTIIDKFLNGSKKEGKVGYEQILGDIESYVKSKTGNEFKFDSLDKRVFADGYYQESAKLTEEQISAIKEYMLHFTQKAIQQANDYKRNEFKKKVAKGDKAETDTLELVPELNADLSNFNDVFKGTMKANLELARVIYNSGSSDGVVDFGQLRHMTDSMLMHSVAVRNIASVNPSFFSLFNKQGGVNGYKVRREAEVYQHDALTKTFKETRKEGGIRSFSNSDFEIIHFFDWLQYFTDLTAMGEYSQNYTKVLADAKLFGLSGGKINMSAIPSFIIALNGNKVDQQVTEDICGLDENGNLIFDSVEGIDIDEAMMLAEDSEYSKNCGIISIGYSYEQVWKLLDDKRIAFIIGFHAKSNDKNKRFEKARYATNFQKGHANEATKSDGSTVHISFSEFINKAEELIKNGGSYVIKNSVYEEKGKLYKFSYGGIEHEFYGKGSPKGETEITTSSYDDIPKIAAQMYRDYCEEKGYAPAYNVFSGHENYYKCLADFTLYDSNGHYAPHNKVELNMPTQVPVLVDGKKTYIDTQEYIENELGTYLGLRQKTADLLADNTIQSEIVAIEKNAKFKENSETVAWRMLNDPTTHDEVMAEAKKYKNELNEDSLYVNDSSNGDVRYSLVDGDMTTTFNGKKVKTLDFLNDQLKNGEVVEVYRAMQLIDGGLRPPMTAYVNGVLREETPLKRWEQAEERPDLATKDGKFKLDKGATTRKKTGNEVPAAYNPYIHTSFTMLNDQFSSAFLRPNLVVVKGYIPKSELTSGYKAENAKDSVGVTEWHSGTVQGNLENVRKVVLSRWFYPVEIVSNEEVASSIKELVKDSDVKIPFNVVSPLLYEELVKQGVEIGELAQLKKDGNPTLYEYNRDIELYKNGNMGKVSNVTSKSANTRYSLDSEGNELSKAQQEFFKDSKVRNDNGNLLVVYHGTQNEFTVFEPNEWVTEKSGLTQVKGYFSENEEYSKIYGDTKPYYLNIKNPLYATERWSMTLDEWVKWFNSKGITNIKFDSGIEEDTLKGGDTNKGIEYSFYELIDRGDYWYGDGNVTERIKDAGYDGITWEEEGRAWIPFERNAIKSTSNTSPTTSSDTRYSIEAPTFYSQMSRTISDIKQDKLGANSVVSYLKGRGVKDEEIKWSGIETFLDGKKSVTKEELQEFASGSMLNIEEKTLGYNKELLDDTFKKLIESNGDKYEGYEPNGNDSWVILSTLKDGTKDRWVVDGEELWEEYFDAETQSKWSKQLTNWKEYKLSGGSNYRELLFKMPNADYSNHAMEVHWGEQGVLAHARIQDMRTIEGQDMLFIEEIQSDWHNAGNKEGYVDKSKMLTVKNTEMKHEDGWYSLYSNGEELHQGVSDEYIKQRFRNGITDEEIHNSLVDEYNEVAVARNNGVDLVPDAPFKNNYTDYVIKRLLRMASEGGYDSIGWTTAKQQEERWSSQYAEGYRIEYDQDIPKFLNKYGKKWDGKVDKTELKNGEEVWQFVIPQSMKESVVRDGQPMYQLDSEYMSLANDPAKNEARLRELVEQYARASGYDSPLLYHGTEKFGFTKIDIGMLDDKQSIFLTDDPLVAESYSGTPEIRPISDKLKWERKGKTDKQIIDKYNELFPHETDAKLVTKEEVENKIKKYDKDIDNDIESLGQLSKFSSNETLKESFNLTEYDIRIIKKLGDLYSRSKDMDSIDIANEFKEIVNSIDYGSKIEQLVGIWVNGEGFANSVRLKNKLERLIDSGATLVKSGEYIRDINSIVSAIEQLVEENRINNLGNYGVYAKLGNSLTVDANDNNFDDLMLPKELKKYATQNHDKYYKTREIASMAKEAGYDSVIFEDITDVGGEAYDYYQSNVYVLFDPTNIKSADLITYDDNGNIIPLSQRFRSSNNDIRYSLDDRYERKQRYVDRLMKENAKSSKLTEEQHKVLADVARMRHELHVGKDDLWNPNSGEYGKLWGYIDSGINDELKSVGLKPIDFGINTDSVPSVEDFNLLGYDEDYEDINDWFENGEQYKEFIFTMEEINRKIEKYLQNIDEENGTKYAPKGYSRMYSLDDTRYMEDTNSIYQKAYARQDKAFRKTDIDNMVSDVYKAWNDAFGGGISISGASNMLYNTFNSFWKGTKQDSISEVRDIFFSNMRLNGERLTEAQKETMASYQDALTRSMYEKYGNETPIGKANSQIKEDREQMRDAMQKAKEEQETMKNYVSLRLMTESLKELSKRKYVGAGTVVDDQMQTIAQMFSKIISKGQIDPTATREAMKLYDEFYKKALEYVVDSDEFVSRFLPEIGDAIHGIAIGEGALSSAEIKDTTTILKNLRTIYSQDNQIIVNGKKLVATETATKEIHAESKYLAHKNSRTGRFQKTIQGLDKIRNSFVYQGITPIQVVRSLEFYDSHGYLTQMFEDIMRGRAKSSADYANIMRPINDFIDDTKGFEKHMIKDVIKYQGHEMTIGQAMALYMTSKRPEAELTLTETGFTYEYKGEKIHCGANTIEGIQGEIHSQFTEDDKQYIKLLETALDECRALKTDTDLAYYGFTNVSNGYYFPMSRDRMTIRSEVSNLKDMFKNIQTVTSKSFNKNLAQGAKNELYIDDASIVVERHTRGVSDYANLVIPFNTWDRVWNRTVEIGGNKTTVRQFVNEKVWTSKTHDAADKYFTKLFADIQGVRNPPTLSDKVFNYLRASYVSSALGLNLSSILKQTGSFGTASLYVDWKYLLRAIPMRADFNQMWKYSDVANGRMFQRAILQGEGNVDKTIMNNRFLKKATEVTGYGVEWMDRQVVGRIWNALKLQEAEILGKDTESEEVLKEAGKKLDQVINDTQSTATADTRSGFQRDTNPLMSTFTMFTSDAVKQCSNIFDAMSRLTYAGMRKKMGIGSDTEVKEAQKFALRQAGSFLAAITITVAIIQLIKSLLHKERKDNLGVDIASDYLGEAIGILPFVNQAYSLMADGYEVNSFVFDDFNDAVTSVTGIYGVLSKVAQGEDIDSYEVGRPLKKAANTIGNIFGIPVRNVTNYTTGILKTVSPSAGYELDSFFKQTSLSSDLNEAIENGKDKTAQKIIELALKKNGNDSTLASEILELIKNGESVSSVISTSSSSSETKTRSQVKTYKSVMSKADAQAEKMTISDTYAELTNEEKASALNSLYSRYKQTASYKAYGGDLDMSSAYSLLANQSTVAPIVARIKTIEADNSHSRSENVTTYLNSLSISNDEKFVALYQSGYRSNSVKEQMVAIIKRSSLTDAEKQTLIKSLE